MRRFLLAAALSGLLLLPSGCASPPPAAVPSEPGTQTATSPDPNQVDRGALPGGPVSPEEAAAPAGPVTPTAAPTAAELSEQAVAALNRQEYHRAAALFRRAAEQEPTADRWSDASYAHLLARQWQEVLETGKRALALDREHPYALYNTGVAHLELGEPCLARYYLVNCARLQPDRPEVHIAVARAYLGEGRHALAAYHLAHAAALAPDHPGLTELRQALAADRTAEPEGAPLLTYRDGAVTLSLHRTANPGCGPPTAPRPLTLVLTDAEGRTFQMPFVGEGATVLPVALDGGLRGYWLVGEKSGAYSEFALSWRLFLFDGQDLAQTLFLPPPADPDRFAILDAVGTSIAPKLNGPEIITERFDWIGGTVSVVTAWRLSDDRLTAVPVSVTDVYEAELLAAGPHLRFRPHRRDGAPTEYEHSFPLARGAQIYWNGQRPTAEELQVGMRLRLLVRDEQIIAVTVLAAPTTR